MKKSIEIIMFGDSITGRGEWQILLGNEHLINLGVDGDTTSGMLSRLDTVLEIKPKQFFLMAGINDLCMSIPLEVVFKNYTTILSLLKENGIKTTVQLTLLTQMPAVNKKVKLFNEMIVNYCQENDVEYIDLNEPFSNDEGLLREDLTTDGLHLGQKAYKAWAYKIKPLT